MPKSFKLINDGDEPVTIRLSDPDGGALVDTPIEPGVEHTFFVSDGIVLSEAPDEVDVA